MLQLRVFPRWHSARSFPALFFAAITSCPATHFPALFFDVLPHLPRRLLILPSNKPWGDVGARNRQSHNDYKPVNRLKDLVPTTSLYTVRQNSIGIIPYNHLEPALKSERNQQKRSGTIFSLLRRIKRNIFISSKSSKNSHVNHGRQTRTTHEDAGHVFHSPKI